MSLTNKPLDTIEEADLQELIENQVSESKTVEYKQSLLSDSDSNREFLSDVSSFANAAGGHLIYGMREEEGVPVELCGLQIDDVDAEILRLENLRRDGVEPRIPGVSIKDVPLQNSKVALVIRIAKSWSQPHRVVFRRHLHFYSRHSRGKYPLDVAELRTAFSLSDTAAERIRNFRTERLGIIVAGETPVALDEGAKIVLHIVPFSASDPSVRFDLSSLPRSGDLQPMFSRDWNNRHNFDGYLTNTQPSDSGSVENYLQIFRTGSIEAVESRMLLDRGNGRKIPSGVYESELIETLSRFLRIQKSLDVEPPLFIMLTLLGVHGYIMGVDRAKFWSIENNPIDRDALILPEIMIETFDVDATQVLRPAFDAIWNAAGWPRSMNYDEDGKWVGR